MHTGPYAVVDADPPHDTISKNRTLSLKTAFVRGYRWARFTFEESPRDFMVIDIDGDPVPKPKGLWI
jgi:hypothetical protein